MTRCYRFGGLFLSSTQSHKLTATTNARVVPGPNGLVSPALSFPKSLAADGAGNLWSAYPTITPLVAATSTNRQGTRP